MFRHLLAPVRSKEEEHASSWNQRTKDCNSIQATRLYPASSQNTLPHLHYESYVLLNKVRM